jgi:hypothetical protein
VVWPLEAEVKKVNASRRAARRKQDFIVLYWLILFANRKYQAAVEGYCKA